MESCHQGYPWSDGITEGIYKTLGYKVDSVFINNTTSAVKNFDLAQAKKFVRAHTAIPTGCVQQNETTLALLGYLKLPQEQGAWAAETALRILSGTSPGDIPMVANQKAEIYLNLSLADILEIHFPLTLVKQAKLIRTSPIMAAN